MSLYYRTLYAWKCKGTHHKLAMEALRLLSGDQSENWRNLFLKSIEPYLTGSKDPDKKFRDFRNHVLHVQENYWGGAVKATQEWYAKARQQFADRQWSAGVYSAGVMSHYLTDVFCPLHTGQSKAETIIHRACEWSVSCSYDELIDILEEDLGGFPSITISKSDNWLEELIQTEAGLANQDYESVVKNYNFDRGAKDPPSGLDEELAKDFAKILGRAAVSLSLVLERCLKECGQQPPAVSLSLHSALSQATIPVFWITKNMADSAERKVVTRIYNELKQTGDVVENLPEENRVIATLIEKYRRGEAETSGEQVSSMKPKIKVSGTSEKVKSPPKIHPVDQEETIVDPFIQDAEPFGAKPVHSNNSVESASDDEDLDEDSPNHSEVTHLDPDSPIVDAPSIGPKTASRFKKIGIKTVGEFLESEPESIVQKLNTRWINLELVITWQQQTQLMCMVPGLRAHDVQLLTGVGVESYQDLCASTVDDLHPLISEYAASPEGQRVIRSGKIPDRLEIEDWIQNAQWCDQERAA
ncbi:DUF4332 domain-containing protein [Rubinisphaera italica]|nr:DUF4332 domain-containing protein [Rubinisphaera italica]